MLNRENNQAMTRRLSLHLWKTIPPYNRSQTSSSNKQLCLKSDQIKLWPGMVPIKSFIGILFNSFSLRINLKHPWYFRPSLDKFSKCPLQPNELVPIICYHLVQRRSSFCTSICFLVMFYITDVPESTSTPTNGNLLITCHSLNLQHQIDPLEKLE